MRKINIAVIGGGPAGLGAAIEAAKAGADVVLFDENSLPGGQLFKQIHKFFGSKNHYAGTRGFAIGTQLLDEAKDLNVEIKLDSKVLGLLENNILSVLCKEEHETYQADAVIIATGAKENALNFSGWTLPGVMTAGAAQTFVNVHRVKPGKKAVVIGSGNVGLIVAYQLRQAGIKVEAIVEALPQVTGYEVHAAKNRRIGVPILTSHTIQRALGYSKVEAVELVEINSDFSVVKGSEKILEVDMVCLSVGLTPRTELPRQYACIMGFNKVLGGHLPLHNKYMETDRKNVFVAGDVAGVEEASSALEEGRIAGIAAAKSLGYLGEEAAEKMIHTYWQSLDELRSGQRIRKEAKESILQEAMKKNE